MINYNKNTTNNKGTGNKCGHRPDSPRCFTPPEKHAKRPQIIREAIKKVGYYYANPVLLPGLNAANQSDRQQRSERREACTALLQCLLHYTDLVTLRVGIPQLDGSMAGLTMAYLAELSGLDERRADRAVADLKTAGIITVHEICQKLEDATYKGLAALRVVSGKLFGALGMGKWLRHERDKASARQAKKDARRNAKAAANVQMAMGAQRGRASSSPNGGKRQGSKHVTAHLTAMRDILKGKDPPD